MLGTGPGRPSLHRQNQSERIASASRAPRSRSRPRQAGRRYGVTVTSHETPSVHSRLNALGFSGALPFPRRLGPPLRRTRGAAARPRARGGAGKRGTGACRPARARVVERRTVSAFEPSMRSPERRSASCPRAFQARSRCATTTPSPSGLSAPSRKESTMSFRRGRARARSSDVELVHDSSGRQRIAAEPVPCLAGATDIIPTNSMGADG